MLLVYSFWSMMRISTSSGKVEVTWRWGVGTYTACPKSQCLLLISGTYVKHDMCHLSKTNNGTWGVAHIMKHEQCAVICSAWSNPLSAFLLLWDISKKGIPLWDIRPKIYILVLTDDLGFIRELLC